MSGLGHKQPLTSLAAQRLVSAKSGHSGHFVKETLDTHLASRYCGKNKPTTLADHEQTGNAAQQVASWYYLFSQHKHG